MRTRKVGDDLNRRLRTGYGWPFALSALLTGCAVLPRPLAPPAPVAVQPPPQAMEETEAFEPATGRLPARPPLPPAGERTVADAVDHYGPDARRRLRPWFARAGIAYPPREVVLLATKRERRLELWARDDNGLHQVRVYSIAGLSGRRGPKLREGDRQVPEGFYRLVALNPNSRFHLSMKLDYPNAFDLRHARSEGRDQPGSNIFIHGDDRSIGCLAMGDHNIEELFVLAADTGIDNLSVVIAPEDPRGRALSARGLPDWVDDLYRRIEAEFSRYGRRDG